MITGNVKYYAITGNSRPVELKTLIPITREKVDNNNSGNMSNQGLVNNAGNSVQISGSGTWSNTTQRNNGNNTNNTTIPQRQQPNNNSGGSVITR